MAVDKRLNAELPLGIPGNDAGELGPGFVYAILDHALPRGAGVQLAALLELTDSLTRCLQLWADRQSWASHWERPSASEAYLELERPVPRGELMSWIEGLKDALDSECGIDMSFGLATTRTTAKLCARMARPNGVLLWEPGFEQGLLAAVPLEELDDLTEHQMSALREAGIRTLGDLSGLTPARARELLGPSAATLLQGLCPSTSQSEDAASPGWLAELARALGEQLSRRDAWARGIELEFGYRTGVRDLRYHRLSRPTRRAESLLHSAEKLFRALPERNQRPVGIRLTATGIYSNGQLPLVGAIASDVSVYHGRLPESY